MLDPFAVDANGCHQHQVLGDVDAIDLYHQEIEPGKIRLHKALHALARQRHKMSRCRGLRRPGSRWCRNIALRKPYRPTEFPRRDIDEHQIHRPLPEPVFPCVCPQRYPRRPSPRAWRGPQNSSASCSIIAESAWRPAVKQNRSKLADTSFQALPTAPPFIDGKAVSVVLRLFMALLSFVESSTPSLQAQGEQRRSFFFNIPRDNSRNTFGGLFSRMSNTTHLFMGEP